MKRILFPRSVIAWLLRRISSDLHTQVTTDKDDLTAFARPMTGELA
jgi:hypothetical protein